MNIQFPIFCFNSWINTSQLSHKNESSFALKIIQEVGSSHFEHSQYKVRGDALIFECRESVTHRKVVFKVLSTTNAGFAKIYYSGLYPFNCSTRDFTVPIEARLLDYIRRIATGNLCGIFRSEDELNSTLIEIEKKVYTEMTSRFGF